MNLIDGLLLKFSDRESVTFLTQNKITFNFVLHDYLLEAFARLPEDKFHHHFFGLLDSVVFFYKKYSAISDPLERTRIFHRDVNEIISRDIFGPQALGAEILCTKGCSSCCSQLVSLTQSEAKLLKQNMEEKSLLVDWPRLNRQRGLDMETWTKTLTEEQAKCVFLNSQDGSCVVWKDRPANCRNYFVSGTNQFCSVFNRNSDLSRSHKSILADTCISAFYALDGGAYPLAEIFTDPANTSTRGFCSVLSSGHPNP